MAQQPLHSQRETCRLCPRARPQTNFRRVSSSIWNNSLLVRNNQHVEKQATMQSVIRSKLDIDIPTQTGQMTTSSWLYGLLAAISADWAVWKNSFQIINKYWKWRKLQVFLLRWKSPLNFISCSLHHFIK